MRVLLATKGSTPSENAVQMLLALAQKTAVSATILTVIKDESETARVREVLAHVVGLLETAVVAVDTRLRVGETAVEIVNEANEGQYDLVITGRHAADSLLTRLLGSVTYHLLNHLSCSLLIAKERARPIHKVLLCDSGELAPPLLERFVDNFPALLQNIDLTCLHVMSQISAQPGIPGKQLRAEAEELIQAHTPEGEWLARNSRILAKMDIPYSLKVRHGRVVDEIVAEAQGGDYDLVVIGAHRVEGWPQLLLDNLARQIVAEVKRPVLIIP